MRKSSCPSPSTSTPWTAIMDRRDADAAREPVAEPAALPWGMDKSEVQKSSLTALTDEKLARFVIGQQKKTKFEKEREEREAKKRRADEEAAAMYAKFVASFEDGNDEDAAGKAFVRGSGRGSEDGGVYRLQGTAGKKRVSEVDRFVEEMRGKELAAPRKRLREMDLLIEEIKSRESTQQPSVLYENHAAPRGSFDTGDPDTTNLYVGNLPPSVTEERLERVFGKYGRIHSVKIMWPRSEEERGRRRMSGFVSFFERRHADDARVKLNDSELDGQRIVVGWGKAVKIEAMPTPAAASTAPALVIEGSRVTTAPVSTEGRPTVAVRLPDDKATRSLIDRLASYVAKDGLEFENAVRAREAKNPHYAFLFAGPSTEPQDAPLAVYYRWRVFAYAMGDTETSWREAPFQMSVNGPVWVPPPLPKSEQQIEIRDQRRQRSRSWSRSRSHSRSRGRSSGRRRSRSHSRSRSSRRRGRHSPSSSRSRSRSSSSDRSSHARPRHRHHSVSRSPSRSRTLRGEPSRRRSPSPKWQSRRGGDRDRRSWGADPVPTSVSDPVLKKDESMLTGQQLARARDLELGREPNRMPRDEYDRFMDHLEHLILERESIKQAMGCALDNSESAVEIVHLLRRRFHRDDVSAVQLIGYLYLASDILHNSSAAMKNASLFRTTFQDCLPEIMDRLRCVYKSIVGRMSAIAMRDKVLGVLTAWGSWSLFPPHYLVGLNATFMRKVEEEEYLALHGESLQGVDAVSEEKLRKTCTQAGILSTGSAKQMLARLQWLKDFTAPGSSTATSTTPTAGVKKPQPMSVSGLPRSPIAPESHKNEVRDDARSRKAESEDTKGDVDGESLDEDGVDGEPMDEEEQHDLDGERMDEKIEDDLDGEPLDDNADVDGEPMDDLDGEPLDGDEDVDGLPLDEEDLDGEPM